MNVFFHSIAHWKLNTLRNAGLNWTQQRPQHISYNITHENLRNESVADSQQCSQAKPVISEALMRILPVLKIAARGAKPSS